MRKIWITLIVCIIAIVYINIGKELHILSINSKKPSLTLEKPYSPTTSIATSSVYMSTTTETASSTAPKTKVASSTPQKTRVTTNKPTAKTTQATTTPVSQITISPLPVTPSEPAPDFEKINETTRKAIVNILCTTKTSELYPISGTGVIVSSGGLILTNAHIGQYFLLKDYREPNFVQCIARTGSPAYPTYTLELVYISPTWVSQNQNQIKAQDPKGTGENDYAFLRITGRIDGSNQTTYPFVPMDIRENIDEGENVLLASYPAGFLGGQSIIQGLSIASAVGQIGNLYTFKEGMIDLISIPGTIISQKGSSGGAVVDKRTHLIGLISLSSISGTTAERDLKAITSAYINRDLKTSLNLTLPQIIYGDYADLAKTFASTTAPNLTKILIDSIESK